MGVHRESLDDWGGASVMEPWEGLVRDRALMGVVGKAMGGAADGGASGWLTWPGGLFGIPGTKGCGSCVLARLTWLSEELGAG